MDRYTRNLLLGFLFGACVWLGGTSLLAAHINRREYLEREALSRGAEQDDDDELPPALRPVDPELSQALRDIRERKKLSKERLDDLAPDLLNRLQNECDYHPSDERFRLDNE